MAIDLRPLFPQVSLPGPGNQPYIRPAATGAGVFAGALAQVAEATDLLAEEEATRSANTAFNDSVMALSDFRQGLKGRQDYQAFAGDYATFWRDQKAKVLGGLNSRARAKVEDRLAHLEIQGKTAVQDLAWDRQTDIGRADLLRQADQAFEIIGRDPDSPEAEEAWNGYGKLVADAVSTGLIDQEAGERLRQDGEQRFGIAQVSALIDANPYDAKKRLKAGEFDSLLQPEKKAALLNAADAGIEHREAVAKRAQAEADKAAEYDRQLKAMELELAVESGDLGEAGIRQALADKIITPAAAGELIQVSRKAGEKLAEEQKMVERVGAALDGTGPALSPTDTNDVKAANLAYDGWAATLDGKDADERSSLIAEWIGRTGVVPQAVENEIRSGALGSPQEAIAAADLLDRIEDRNPAVGASLDGQTYAYLRAVQDRIEGGMEPAKAEDVARQQVLETKAPERQERERRWTADKLDDAARTYLQDEAGVGGGVFGGAVPLPDGLTGQFMDFARDYYVKTGDAAQAYKMALDDVQRIWGKSEFAEGGWMPYPPEKVYGSGEGSADWMQEQLDQDMKALGLTVQGSFAGVPIEAKPETRLVPQPSAARQAQPGYYVEMQNPDGVWELLLDKETGQPLVWRPDYATSPAATKAKTQAEKDIEAGKQDRQDRIDTGERMGDSPLDSFILAPQP